MKHLSKIGIAACALLLVGQGCLGGNSGPPMVGGLWQTADVGRSWAQLNTYPRANEIATISGASVREIKVDPNDPAAYYIGTEQNGMFFSYDYGATWQRPKDPQASSGMALAIEVDPRSVCTIYMLKPDRLLKSTNCSRTFEDAYVETRANSAVSRFAMDWFNPDILWAGTTQGDVMKSMDGGLSWSTVIRVRSDVTAIEVSNVDSRVIYVGTRNSGFYKSTDGGETWASHQDDMKEFNRSSRVFGFAQTADGSTLVMNSEYGLLKSEDQGETWESIPLVTPPGGVRIWSVALDPKNGDIIYYGTQGIFYQSTSGGNSWITRDFPTAWVPRAMEVHPEQSETVLVGFFNEGQN